MAQLQVRVRGGKGTTHKALRAHVIQKPGQPRVTRANAIRFFNPKRTPFERHRAGKRRQGTRQRGLAHAQQRLQLDTGQHTTLAAQVLHSGGSEVYRDRNESS